MDQISGYFLFFLSALGVFNGTLLSTYLFFAKPRTLANKLLATLLLAISIRVGKSIFFYFYPELAKHYLQLGLTACFFIGPLLYLYSMQIFTPEKSDIRTMKVQLGIPLVVAITFGVVYPYVDFPELWGNVIYKVVNYFWLACLLLAVSAVLPVSKKLKKKESLTPNEFIGISVYVGTFFIWFAYYTASFTSYIAGALSFTFCFYLSILLVLFHKKQVKQERYSDKKIEEDKATPLIEQLNVLMADEALYKNANLTLAIVAKKMSISVPQLSQLLNDNVGQSFTSYVNQYRVNLAKELLTSNQQLSLEQISEQCGYNSQSTFYTAFKKFVNTTPAKYRKEHCK